jgi:hypothetical protein
MSIHQNSYFIVPKNGAYDLFSGLNLKSFLEDDFFEDDLFWKATDLNIQNLNDYLGNIFEINESWSESLNIYGNPDKNCIKVIHENNLVVSIILRISILTDYSKFIEKTIRFCELYNLVLVDSELDVLALDFNSIKKNIMDSKAFKNFKKF